MMHSYDYAHRVPLVACPFCREMFEQGEHPSCPLCGVALTPFEKLPPSHDAMHEDGIPVAPEHEPLPRGYMGRGKGALAALSLVGLILFFLPWIQMTLPDIVAISGFDLARRLGWSWGAAVAWVVLVPTVLSRKSIAELRGARVAAAFLSAVPAVTVTILLLRPPHGGLVPVRFTYDWPLYATLVVSVVAAAFAVTLGGRVDDIKVSRGSSHGQALH
jgi:hypothetical protein